MAIAEGHRQGTRAKLGAALQPSWPGSPDELQTLVSQVEQQIFEKAKGLADYEKRVEKRIAKIPVAVARTSTTPPPPESRASQLTNVAPAPTPTVPPTVLDPAVTPVPAPPLSLAPTPASQLAQEEDHTAEVLAAAKAHESFIDAFRKRFPTPSAVQATDQRVVAKLQELVADVQRFDALASGRGPPVTSIQECNKLCASFVSVQTVCEKLIQRGTAVAAAAAAPTSQATAPTPTSSSLSSSSSSSSSGSSSSGNGYEANSQVHAPALLPSKRPHDDTLSSPSSAATGVPPKAREAPTNAQAMSAAARARANPERVLREGAALARKRLHFEVGATPADELPDNLRVGLLALARSDSNGRGGMNTKPTVALGRAPPLGSSSSVMSGVSAGDRAKAQLLAAHFNLYSPSTAEARAKGDEDKTMDAASDGSSSRSAASLYLQRVEAAVQGCAHDLCMLASAENKVKRLEATMPSTSSGGSGGDGDLVVFFDLSNPVVAPASPQNGMKKVPLSDATGTVPQASTMWPCAVAVLTLPEAAAWRLKQSGKSSTQILEWPLDASADRRCRALATAATAAINKQQQQRCLREEEPQDMSLSKEEGGEGVSGGAAATAALLRLLHRLNAVAVAPEPDSGPEEMIRLAQLACLWLPAT